MIRAIQKIRLFRAVRNNDLPRVKRLVKFGADLNVLDKRGRSLLAIAYHFNCTDLIDFLRDNGIREEINRLYNYARRCLKSGELSEAKKRFEELQKFFPNDSSIFYYQGTINYKISKSESIKDNTEVRLKTLEDAFTNLTKALELNEEDYRLDDIKMANANYILSVYFYKQQKLDEAVLYSKKALENVEEHEGATELLKKMGSIKA